MTTTTVDSPSLPAVGERISSRRQLSDLPVGSVIRCNERYGEETKIMQGQWRSERRGTRSQTSISPDRYMYTLVSIGPAEEQPVEEPVTVPRTGDTIVARPQFGVLPVGSIITSSSGRTALTRTEDGYRSQNGNAKDMTTLRLNYYRVTHVPGEQVDESEETMLESSAPTMTLDQFKQRFRTLIVAASNYNGISPTVTQRALRRMEVPEYDPQPGMYVCYRDSELYNSLPDGTVLTFGEDPADYLNYAVYIRRNGSLTKCLGGWRDNGSDAFFTYRVLQVPGVEPGVLAAAGSESELEAVYEFRKMAWETGWQVKLDQSWCGTYEECMRRAGVDESAVSVDTGTISAEEVAALPAGTVLRFRPTPTHSVLYRRDDAAGNPARTRRIAGNVPGSWARQMAVVWLSGQTMAIPILSHEEMDAMPVGTVIGEVGARQRWTKREPDGHSRAQRVWFASNDPSYGYTSRQFSVGSIRYVELP